MEFATSGGIRRGFALASAALSFLVAPTIASAETGGSATGEKQGPQGPAAGVIDGSYIVVYNDEAVQRVGRATTTREHELGFRSDFVYRNTVEGFAAELSASQVQALESDRLVDFVSENRQVAATGVVPIAPGEPTPPTGTRRILAASTGSVREESGVNVAVIDTGIQLNHPDLNAAAGTDCVDPGTSPEDGNGHGTHVAGTIAAQNNGVGVTGVAPGTQVYAVRVLDDSGSGTTASVVCGIDWVTANAPTMNIGVANVSLGGGGSPVAGQTCATTTDAMRQAICNSTAAGVDFVVAAGNDGNDFDFQPAPSVPAAYPEVLTVTALSDSDGIAGGTGGSPSCWTSQLDDRPASFSNYAASTAGQAHTIAAPGTCITSTWLAGSYNTISGTSMASPHMAGVVALCINEAGVGGPCAGIAPAQVISHMRSDAASYSNANPDYGFEGDPISNPASGFYYGFLTRVPPPSSPSPSPPPPPPSAPTAPVLTLELDAKARQAVEKLRVTATCSAACTLTLRAQGQADVEFESRKTSADLAAETPTRLKLKFKQSLLTQIADERAKATITTSATGLRAQSVVETTKVRLKP